MKETAPPTRQDPLRELRRLQFWLRLVSRLAPSERHVPLLWAVIVGFLGAAAALLFIWGTYGVQWLLTGGMMGEQVETFEHLQIWQRLLVPTVGGLVAGLLIMFTERVLRRRALDYMEAVALGDGILPVRSSLMRSLAALFSIASGAAIGREGPLVQLAALAASVSGRLRRMAPARLRLMVACGAAAGIAAAYNAPIAGALFVAEIILGSIAMESLGPLLLASAVAAFTVRLATGNVPLYAFAGFEMRSPWELLLFVLLGVVCAAGAHLFMRLLAGGRWLFARVPGPAWLRLGLGGLAVGVATVWLPQVAGNGQGVIRSMLGGEFGVPAVAVLLVVKLAAVALVFGSGAVGGVFTPSLFGGAALGFLLASAAGLLFPHAGLAPAGFAVVGMGAFLAAATQAPMMAILMIFEMSLQYQIMLPLMVAVVAAHVTARSLGTGTLYSEALHSGPRTVFDKPLGRVTAGDLMRLRLRTVVPGAKFREVARQFLRAPARELFVAEPDGRFAGAILMGDVRPYLRDVDLAEVVSARDIARDDVPALDFGLGLPEAMAVFSRCTHESLPVVEGPERKLVGTLQRSDLFLAVSELARRESVRETGAA